MMKKFYWALLSVCILAACEGKVEEPAVSLKEKVKAGLYMTPAGTRQIISRMNQAGEVMYKKVTFLPDSLESWQEGMFQLSGWEILNAANRQYAMEARLGEETIFGPQTVATVEFFGDFDESMLVKAIVSEDSASLPQNFTILLNKGGMDLTLEYSEPVMLNDSTMAIDSEAYITHFFIDESKSAVPAASDSTSN